MPFGTASWMEAGKERQALVAPLPSDPRLLVDLNRLEQVRLAKLGEGRPEALAEVLVPPSLRRVLAGGPRALHRLEQAMAYAEKWRQRTTLPEFVARPIESVVLLPCLPRPALLRQADGGLRDRHQVLGPGSTLAHVPRPTMAALGMHGGKPAGFCLALEDGERTVLGAWMVLDWPAGCEIRFVAGSRRRSIPFSTWEEIPWPALRPGEVMVFPPPILRAFAHQVSTDNCRVAAPFEELVFTLGEGAAHATLQ